MGLGPGSGTQETSVGATTLARTRPEQTHAPETGSSVNKSMASHFLHLGKGSRSPRSLCCCLPQVWLCCFFFQTTCFLFSLNRADCDCWIFFLKPSSFLSPAPLHLIFFPYRVVADSLSPWHDGLLHQRQEAAPPAATPRMPVKNKSHAGRRASLLGHRSGAALHHCSYCTQCLLLLGQETSHCLVALGISGLVVFFFFFLFVCFQFTFFLNG